jgi:Response regulator containing CheY-like receiver domain and AraC-type DNA-binding domain
MYKVMIVEDEMFVRTGIKYSIDWTRFDMYVISDVGDGQTAWETYQKVKPDLILTDIKMPVMDGIQLIEKIRKDDKDTEIIILSCLDEFQLAQKAIKLDVSDYILKLSMSNEEMEAVLERARAKLDNKVEKKPNIVDAIRNMNIMKDRIIMDYLFDRIYTESEFAGLAAELMHLQPTHLIMCIMEIDHYELFKLRISDKEGKLVHFSILNILNEQLESCKRGAVCHEKDKRYIIILGFPDMDDNLDTIELISDILAYLRRALKTYFDISASFGISNMYDGYSSLKGMYTECTDALEYKYFMGTGKDLYINRFDSKALKADVKEKMQHILNHQLIYGKEFVMEWNSEDSLFSGSSELTKEAIQNLFLEWGYKAFFLAKLNLNDITGEVVNYSQQIAGCETMDEAAAKYVDYLKSISNNRMKKKIYSREIAIALKYIKEHYYENISLQKIAGMVELSPHYLSSLFKSEFGSGLIGYVTQFKIEKAKELLMNTNLKSYEIAEKVGFTDESYFSRTFKKITGIRPIEYKKQCI